MRHKLTYRPENLFLVIRLSVMVLVISLVSGCEQKKPGVAAPLNEMASLEKLAAAYEEISQQIPVSPVNLAPKARKKFVEQVFEKAGFDYLETLKSLTSVKPDEITKLHRDMRELLFLPHYGLQQDIMEKIYSEEEQKVITQITSKFG